MCPLKVQGVHALDSEGHHRLTRRTSLVDDDVGEGGRGVGWAQHVCGVDAVACKFLDDGVAHGIIANDRDQRGLDAEARCCSERICGVAPALKLW